jgi:hypothetical protein
VLWNRSWNRNRSNCNFLPWRNHHNAFQFRFRNRIWTRSNIKFNIKVQKSKLETNFLGNNTASIVEKARFPTYFLLLKTVLNKSGSGTGTRPKPEPEPKSEPKLFQNRNRNRNKSLRFHDTGNNPYLLRVFCKVANPDPHGFASN